MDNRHKQIRGCAYALRFAGYTILVVAGLSLLPALYASQVSQPGSGYGLLLVFVVAPVAAIGCHSFAGLLDLLIACHTELQRINRREQNT